MYVYNCNFLNHCPMTDRVSHNLAALPFASSWYPPFQVLTQQTLIVQGPYSCEHHFKCEELAFPCCMKCDAAASGGGCGKAVSLL